MNTVSIIFIIIIISLENSLIFNNVELVRPYIVTKLFRKYEHKAADSNYLNSELTWNCKDVKFQITNKDLWEECIIFEIWSDNSETILPFASCDLSLKSYAELLVDVRLYKELKLFDERKTLAGYLSVVINLENIFVY